MQEVQQQVEQLLSDTGRLKSEIAKVIVGQEEVIEQVLITAIAGGHALLEGVPGLAKTLLIKTLSQALDLSFKRIQFTPDLMPSDVVGTEILRTRNGEQEFQFNKGPVFANMLLADEINRTPPKTQAALLEAMQEGGVTFNGQYHALPDPFILLATQNPIEQGGTYPLPEAQLDRFLLYIKMDYPSEQEEFQVLEQTTTFSAPKVEPVMTAAALLELRDYCRQVAISPDLINLVNLLIRESRPAITSVQEVKTWVDWGAGTRAGQAMILGAKARALLQGRFAVLQEDLLAVTKPVLRHRIITNYKAESEGVLSEDVIDFLVEGLWS